MSSAALDGDDTDEFGPIDYVVVEFPGGKVVADGFTTLLALVEQGVIRVLDLELVTTGADGRATVVDVAEVSDVDLSTFAGASSGLLDRSDLELIAAELSPGSIAAILVYEELAILSVLHAWTAGGARALTAGALTPADLELALDATEPT